MADKSKGPVIFLIFLLFVAIGTAGLGFVWLQKEKQASAKLLEEKEQLERSEKLNKKEIARLNDQLTELKLQRDQQQAKIQEYDKKVAAITDDLAIEKRANEDALAAIEKSKEEMASLKSAKAKAESELKAAKETLKGLQEQLAAAEKAKETLSQKPKEQETKPDAKPQDVQLEKIVVSPSASAASPAPAQAVVPAASPQRQLEGKVLVVNKEYDFVVVNLGQKDNINVADTLEVFRNNKKIGEMKVEEVRDAMSVATPLTKDMIRQIKEDDRVVGKTG